MNYKETTEKYVELTEKYLDDVLTGPADSRVLQAMRYSTLNGGKRIRACLVLACCELFGGKIEDALPYAAAIEMIHAYSLIHDDLPCMDNDSMRRGNPSCHIAFGETVAVLAGDALLTYAFNVTSEKGKYNITEAVKLISFAAGHCGMIYGQELDTLNNIKADTTDALDFVYRHKTGDLIYASCMLGFYASGTNADYSRLNSYSDKLSLAFQITDDILDVTSDDVTLGKNIGSDEKNNKTTYVSILGLDKAKAAAERLTDGALDAIAGYPHSEYLSELASSLSKRIF